MIENNQAPKPETQSEEEAEILQLLEDADLIAFHAHHALVHNPFTWNK